MIRYLTAAAVMAAVLALGAVSWGADSYYLYVDWAPEIGEATHVTGAGGYIDSLGNIEGLPGAEYLFFVAGPSYEGARGAHVGYCYRVETDGDANRHPDNPLDTGPIATRTFTRVSSHLMTE